MNECMLNDTTNVNCRLGCPGCAYCGAITKEDLKNYKYQQEWLKDRIDTYNEQKTMWFSITQNWDNMPHGNSEVMDKMAESVAKLIDEYSELIEKLKEQQEKQNEIVEIIDMLDFPYKTILYKYYIQDKSLVKVADEMHYNYETIRHLNGIAIQKFEEEAKKLNQTQNNTAKHI